jgi:hypothetical protein
MHKYHTTTIDHHDDGSHTIHHEHHNPEEDCKYAVEDLDSMHDGLEHHLGEPNDGEEVEDHSHISHSEFLEEIEHLVHMMAEAEKKEGE